MLDFAEIHYNNIIGQGNRLFLVMGYVNSGGGHFIMNFSNPRADDGTNPLVHMGQGFIQQQYRRFAHQGPGQGDALLLPAAQFAGFALQNVFQFEKFGDFINFFFDFLLIHAAGLQREGNVIKNRQGRIQGIGFKCQGDISFARGQIVYNLAIE